MSADFDTDLERRLAELERTTSHAHLRDPATIRRRGRQRARRQAAGAVAAALTVVGIGAAAVTGLADRAAVPEPAGPLPTTTPEPAPGPSWLWSPDLPVEGTLPATGLPPVGPYGEAEPWADSALVDEQWQGRATCGDVAASPAVRAATTSVASSLDASLRQQVLAFDGLDQAQAAYESWQSECAEVAQVVGQPIPLGPTVAGTAEPADQEYTGALSSTVWLPGTNVVVVVDVIGNIGPADLDNLDDGVARASEQLAESVDRVMGDRATGS